MKKKIMLFTFIIVLIGCAIVFDLYIECVLPYTKTNYRSYEEFRKKTGFKYPEKVPDASKEIEYLHKTGNHRRLKVVAFTIDESEYDEYYKKWKEEMDLYEGSIISNFLSDDEREIIISMSGSNASKFLYRNNYNGGENIRIYGMVGNKRDNRILIFEEVNWKPPVIDLGG